MACKLPEAMSKIEEILSKNGEGIASVMLSGIQINMLNEAKKNLQSAIEIRMSRMQSNNSGSESIDRTKNDFRSEFKNKRPSAAKWADKEVAKFDVATQAISDGTNNSTAGFVKDFYGDKANTGTYTKDDVVYLSTNGNRTGRVIPVKNGVLQGAYKNIDKAIEAGAKFVADTSKHLASTGKYNVGEVELAEYLHNKGYTREDKDGYSLWSLNTSSIQEENKSSEPSNKSLKSKAAGWKIHLSFKVNDDSVSKLEEILNSFDKDTIPSFKIGRNSGQEGKDATIYVGSADNRNLVVNKIQNEFGKYLTEVGEDAKFDDKIHSKGIAYRFDIGAIDNEFHQYGHNGFPALNEDIKNTFGMNKDERTKVFIESSKKSEKILEKKYGTFFTGTIKDSQSYNPQSEPDVEFELVKETKDKIKSNIKNIDGNIVGEIKIRPNSTIKDELERTDIKPSKTKIPKKLLDSKIVMIDDVYIEDDFKRSGYGLKTIEKIKKEYNGSIIMLDAYPTQGNLSKDELVKFYEKSGFKVLEKLNDDTVTFMYADLTGTNIGSNFVYKTISKDDIEAAKDIMSNNKKECE